MHVPHMYHTCHPFFTECFSVELHHACEYYLQSYAMNTSSALMHVQQIKSLHNVCITFQRWDLKLGPYVERLSLHLDSRLLDETLSCIKHDEDGTQRQYAGVL